MYTTSLRRRLRATKARRAQPAGCDICATYNPDATASRARGIWVVRYERMRRCKHQTTTARGRRTTRVGEQTHHPREGPRAWERCPHRHPYPTHPHPLHAPRPFTRACVFVFGWEVVVNRSIQDDTHIPNPPTPPLRPPSFPALSSSRSLTSGHDRPRPFDHRSAPGDVKVCLAFERQRGPRPVSGRRHT